MDRQILLQELVYKAVRSSGAGGQHVNKVSSKVILNFDIVNSKALDPQEKERLLFQLSSRISQDGQLQIKSDTDRSQFRNKELATTRLFELLASGLIVPKARIKKKIPRSFIEKRLKAKREQSQRKLNRRKPDF